MLCLTLLVRALGGTPTLLLNPMLNPMDSQLEEVRHRLRIAEVEVLEIKKDLAIAKQAGNKGSEEEVKFSSWPAGEAG